MSYVALEVGKRWLKNFPALVADAQKGMTQEDLVAAEAWADEQVNSFFARYYDVRAAQFAGAPAVLQIADMLGSARFIEFKFSRDGQADTSLAATLEESARALMRANTRGLIAADGSMLAPVARAVPRVSAPKD